MHTLAGSNNQPECARTMLRSLSNMASADSKAQGLAESTDFKEYEDPARCWIDLVAAFKSGNADSVRAVLTEAKKSHWTHQLFDEALGDADYSTEEEEMEHDADDRDCECEKCYKSRAKDSRNVKKWSKIANAQEEFWEE